MASVISQILKSDGLPGLFIGYYATLIRDVPYTMLELGVYENMKSLLRRVRKVEVLGRNDELAAAAFTGTALKRQSSFTTLIYGNVTAYRLCGCLSDHTSRSGEN